MKNKNAEKHKTKMPKNKKQFLIARVQNTIM
jgi:hypothetical protein